MMAMGETNGREWNSSRGRLSGRDLADNCIRNFRRRCNGRGGETLSWRRNYAGAEVKVTYDNTFDTDNARRRIDVNGGFTLEGGKTNVLIARAIPMPIRFFGPGSQFLYAQTVTAEYGLGFTREASWFFEGGVFRTYSERDGLAPESINAIAVGHREPFGSALSVTEPL